MSVFKRSSSNLLRLKRNKQKIPMQILQIYMGFWYLSCFSSSFCLHKTNKAYTDMLISVIHEHVPGLFLCPNYTLSWHLGFTGVIYSLLMVDDDGICNCTDGCNKKKISFWFSVWALVYVHSILTSGSEWTGEKEKKHDQDLSLKCFPFLSLPFQQR